MRIVFMGTPEFAVPSLQRLIDHGYPIVGVVTAPDKPRGRGRHVSFTPVKEAALDAGIAPILQPESLKDAAWIETVKGLDADLMVVVAFRILPPEVFTLPRLGAFNLHGSLLPKYRGAAPINRAVMAGETVTGVTTFFLKEKVDTGNMILQAELPIGPNETAGEVHDRMMMLGADVVLETVRRIESGTVNPEPQDDSLATPAPKLFKEDCLIPWKAPAIVVHNHVRGLSPHPGAWTRHGDALWKLFRTVVADGAGEPGRILQAADRLVVACGTGAIEVVELQQENRKRLPAAELLRGSELRAGDRFA